MKTQKLFYPLIALVIVSILITSCEKEKTISTPNVNNLEHRIATDDASAPLIDENNTSDLGDEIQSRGSCEDPCNCYPIYAEYRNANMACLINGTRCDEVNYHWNRYQICTTQPPNCPSGFVYDGCNCHSEVYIPSGYQGFVWGNSLYVRQNCGISGSNNCCPTGYGFDGANCQKMAVT